MNILVLIISLFTINTYANDYYINVNQAKTKKLAVAFTPLKYKQTSRSGLDIGNTLYRNILNNLNSTFYFNFINPKAYLEDVRTSSIKPDTVVANGFRYNDWKTIGTDILVKAEYSITLNTINLEIYVYNVSNETLVMGKNYSSNTSNIKKMADKFSNDVMLALTGKPGIFGSQIVVSRSIQNSREKEIFVMDWNGDNVKQISNNKTSSFSPAWSPDGKFITYTSFILHRKQKIRNADLLIYSFETGRTRILSARKGSNSGSAFSRDGRNIFFTISSFGHANIFSIDTLTGRNLTRLTNGPRGAMNIEVDISPNGQKVAFSSDRSGRPMIYVADIDGKNIKRLTYAGRYNSTPVWSPDGQRISFASNIGGYYDIFIIDANGNNLKRLTQYSSFSAKRSSSEEPTFSPDGRSIMFVNNSSGKRQLYITDLNGDNTFRVIKDNHNYYKPKWGWHSNAQ